MTSAQRLWTLSRNQLAKAVTTLGYPEKFADLLASYIWQAHPDSVEMIVDEMVAIREEIAAWREKKEFREVYEA